MIAFDFDYYKPSSIEEAVNVFWELDSRGKEPLYYSGGTEIITMARRNDIFTKAVIDIKGIPECTALKYEENSIVMGSALTLTEIEEKNVFPLLSRISRGIADHTSRNKITLGGNICGRIIYREAVLPLLVSDSMVLIAGREGTKVLPINQVFNKTLNLKKGEILLQIITDKTYLNLPYFAIKRTKLEEIDYPLLTVAAILKDGNIRTAFSGLSNFPFRSLEFEKILNDRSLTLDERVDRAIESLQYPIISNMQAGAEYRRFVLRNILLDILKAFSEV